MKNDLMETTEDNESAFLLFKNIKKNTPLLRTKSYNEKLSKQIWKETAAILLWMTCGPISWAAVIFCLYYLIFFRYLFLLYLLWVYIDRDSCERGGRRRNWFRNLKWFQYMRDYFPVNLKKTVDLPPEKNYLFAVFPHGIISMGSLIVFGTNALKFEEVFKGLKTHICTLKLNFRLPIIREVGLACGGVAASSKSLNWILNGERKGYSATLIVGGAAESLFAEPGTYKVCLKNRKGFCRVALKNGASLVPVFSFGEIDILNQIKPEKHSWLEYFQKYFKKITGIAPIIFFGKGIFGDYIGFIPKRFPLTVVVGKPIDVKKVENPSEEEVEALHQEFIKALIKLFNEEKAKYLEQPDTDLFIA